MACEIMKRNFLRLKTTKLYFFKWVNYMVYELYTNRALYFLKKIKPQREMHLKEHEELELTVY